MVSQNNLKCAKICTVYINKINFKILWILNATKMIINKTLL